MPSPKSTQHQHLDRVFQYLSPIGAPARCAIYHNAASDRYEVVEASPDDVSRTVVDTKREAMELLRRHGWPV